MMPLRRKSKTVEHGPIQARLFELYVTVAGNLRFGVHRRIEKVACLNAFCHYPEVHQFDDPLGKIVAILYFVSIMKCFGYMDSAPGRQLMHIHGYT